MIYLLPIYRARENPDDFSISSEMLFEKIKEKNKNVFFVETIEGCVEDIKKENYDENFILITAGAGDVFKISNILTD
jgi:UDP-N-acetylmuramate-alanine ligase